MADFDFLNVGSTTESKLNSLLNLKPEISFPKQIQIMNTIIKRHGQNIPSLPTPAFEKFYDAAKISMETKTTWDRFSSIIKSDNEIKSCLKQTKVRGRVVGYFFSVLILNCNGTRFEMAEAIMQKCGTFDYEKELQATKWIIPMSGSLHNDIRTNFVASCAQKKDLEWSIDMLDAIHGQLLLQLEDCIASNYSQLATMPYFPDVSGLNSDNAKTAILSYLSSFSDSKSKLADPKDGSAEARIISAGLKNKNSGWLEAFTDGFMLKNNTHTAFRYRPETHFIDNQLNAPDRAFRGFNAKNLVNAFCPSPLALASTNEISAPDLSETEQMYFHKQIMLSQLFDRERLAIQEERRRFAREKKLQAELEKTQKELIKSQNECVRMKDALAQTNQQTKETAAADRAKDQKILLLEERIEKLTNELSGAKETADQFQAEAQKASLEKEVLEQEIEALQALSSGLADDDEEPENNYDTSLISDKKIVCIGGHKAWVMGMRDLPLNLRIFDGDEYPTDNNLTSADIIWIQSNCICHSLVYRATTIARKNNIPYRYFKSAGHRACRKQIIEETIAAFKNADEEKKKGSS